MRSETKLCSVVMVVYAFGYYIVYMLNINFSYTKMYAGLTERYRSDGGMPVLHVGQLKFGLLT